MTAMTVDEKIDYVTGSLIPMLVNDLIVVAESGCGEHGNGSGPNFTLALLAFVACEAVGALAAPLNKRGRAATELFIERVGSAVGDSRYGEYKGLLLAMFRNGVGHSFMPKQTPGLKSRTMWVNTCLFVLRDSAEGQLTVRNLRGSVHLGVYDNGSGPTLHVVTKILVLDVLRSIDAFKAELLRRAPDVIGPFISAFDDWVSGNELIQGAEKLSAAERDLLVRGGIV